MQTGSPEHKAQVCEDLIKTFQENIWKEEIQILEFETLLGNLRTTLAEVDLKLDRKEFKSANEGKKLKEHTESDIESAKAAIERKRADKQNWVKRIDLVKRYAEQSDS